MIAAIAELLRGARTIAVGASSPLPAAAALLAREREGARILMLGNRRLDGFTDGGRELFDCAAQGRIDAFFMSGGQIDGAGEPEPARDRRLPGAAAPLPRLVRLGVPLLRRAARDPLPRGAQPAHDPRARRRRQRAGHEPARRLPARRPGRARDRARGVRVRAGAAGLHAALDPPGETADGVRAATGFAYETAAPLAETPGLPEAERRLLRTAVATGLAATYPRFAAALRAA